jgi:hypothetical protein
VVFAILFAVISASGLYTYEKVEDSLHKPSVEARVNDIDRPSIAHTPKEAQPGDGPVAADAGATRPGGLGPGNVGPSGDGSPEGEAESAGQRFDLSPDRSSSGVDAPAGDPLKPARPDVYAAAKSGHPARSNGSSSQNLKKFAIVPAKDGGKDEGKLAGNWKGITDAVRKKGEAAFEAAVSAFDLVADHMPDSLDIVSRASWKAAKSFAREGHDTPKRITLHHTEGHVTHSLEDSKSAIRNVQEYHRTTRGWGDIGYHYWIDGDGRLFEGRPEKQMGAHTLAHNEDNIGIAIQGNYESVPPTGPQILGFIHLATAVALDNNMDVDDPDFLKGHRDWSGNDTNCPGTALHNMLPKLREVIAEKVKAARSAGRNQVALALL